MISASSLFFFFSNKETFKILRYGDYDNSLLNSFHHSRMTCTVYPLIPLPLTNTCSNTFSTHTLIYASTPSHPVDSSSSGQRHQSSLTDRRTNIVFNEYSLFLSFVLTQLPASFCLCVDNISNINTNKVLHC